MKPKGKPPVQRMNNNDDVITKVDRDHNPTKRRKFDSDLPAPSTTLAQRLCYLKPRVDLSGKNLRVGLQ